MTNRAFPQTAADDDERYPEAGECRYCGQDDERGYCPARGADLRCDLVEAA